MMNAEWETTELCSTVDPNHQHNTQTLHDALTGGESTWQTVLRRFADTAAVKRWTLRSPVERGQIVPGPNALPGNWVKTIFFDTDTDACPPFPVWYLGDNAQPIKDALVWLDRTDVDLVQGLTDDDGRIDVYGAHNGEMLWAETDGGSASMMVSCSPGAASVAVTPSLIISPAAFALDVGAAAAGQDRLNITAKASVPLTGPPAVEIQQVAGSEPLPVTMTYDATSGVYRGQATLPPSGGTQGLRAHGGDRYSRAHRRSHDGVQAAARAGKRDD